MSDTIFHKIIRREIPATIEMESDTLILKKQYKKKLVSDKILEKMNQNENVT